jgi:extracellular elastinolytic metalloproteinase
MKKITLLLLLSSAFFGFSQNKLEKIQQYLNDNKTRLGLSTQDIQELIIESEAVSEGTGINACYVKQRYQGIELFNSTSNFWIKNNAVINGGQGLIPNITQKVNTTAPSLSVLQALSSAVNLLEIHNAGSYQIIEETDSKHFKISNGNLDAPITAELVYQLTTDNKLRLAWDFTIDVVGHQHMWSVRIDALDGKILDKHDILIMEVTSVLMVQKPSHQIFSKKSRLRY